MGLNAYPDFNSFIEHMNPTDFIWQNGNFVPWDQAQTHILTHTLHYSGGAFEGIRAYKTEKGAAIFRLQEHIDRLFYSASILKMEIPWTKEAITQATKEIISKNKIQEGYIRPLVYYGYGIMGLKPFGAPVCVAIACWPWGSYLPHETVDVKVSSFMRIHPRSTVVEAKLCGHYLNSIMASLELRGTEYHEALLLDAEGNIAEGPGENLFVVKNGELITPKLGTILGGITRDTVREIAKVESIKVSERTLSVDDVHQADEAFFTGTAAEITPIRSLDKKQIGKLSPGPVTKLIKNAYENITRGKDARFDRYLTVIE